LTYIDARAERDPLFAAAAIVAMPAWVGAAGAASYCTLVACTAAGGVFGGLAVMLGLPSLGVRGVAWTLLAAWRGAAHVLRVL
jgi:hypothetical protein